MITSLYLLHRTEFFDGEKSGLFAEMVQFLFRIKKKANIFV